MSISVCVLASGSKGNSVYISDGHTQVLVDAGLSGKETEQRMKSRGLSPESLDAIVVSHEHCDHVSGVGVLSRRYQLPVYINEKTFLAAQKIGKPWSICSFDTGGKFNVNGLEFYPFSILHDAADPVGFVIKTRGRSVGIATDFGVATDTVFSALAGVNMLIAEANYDEDMLANGPYPWFLQQRIRSDIGHMSNHDTSELVSSIAHDELLHVVLAHLSQENNTPEKAMTEAEDGLYFCSAGLSVAKQDSASEIFRI